ncbi:gluconate 2-dehydrogenase subunit 3 family protein [Algoriphagus aestuariicola]|uniref:Gluconate 2-dehydrogenase subunit 3 family protein n=1 Tax=Algoriphagus aestuariicola TaxID=1852016 RepID=A0ABS3BUG5_9BACT|nr:gluconate 2-dehydrogenase subunit 3 family protein [Algoriphagus aestuariicola]MBN7802907.1 gluconate 2-dehydrogenase subunit 3 family protein [Algoriphagus aestuariicola]
MNRREAIRKTALGLGTAAGVPTLLSLLQACAKEDRLTWTPQFLKEDQALFVSSFVDFLLPRTDTPGGLDVKADIFMDLMYAKAYDEDGQKNVVAQIEKFNQDCKAKYGAVFAEMSVEDKGACFREQEANSPKFPKNVWGTSVGPSEPVGFYRSLKSMALWAYFSSEEIGKNVLSYDPIPGPYQGCIPLSDVGNTWSL